MPASLSDREQIEELKRYWQDYGKYIVIAVIIGLGVGLGWRYWHQQQDKMHAQASYMYQQLLTAANQQQAETVKQMSGEITKRYPQTEYASLANLMAAKTLIGQDQKDQALEKLNWVMTHSRIASFQQIARLRSARILLTEKKYDQSLKLLDVMDDKTFQPLVDEVRGDVYLAQGQGDKAQQSYSKAQKSLSASSGEDILLSLKLSQPY